DYIAPIQVKAAIMYSKNPWKLKEGTLDARSTPLGIFENKQMEAQDQSIVV
ncbi:hypothetical protein BGZ52_002701, partial [Haplosporangium bisporale]